MVDVTDGNKYVDIYIRYYVGDERRVLSKDYLTLDEAIEYLQEVKDRE